MTPRAEELAQEVILDWVRPGCSVLELGCRDGELLSRLVQDRGIKAQGIETDGLHVHSCVQKGLNVLHEPVEEGLTDYGNGAFDYAIFNESLQRVVKKPDLVLRDALRVADKVIVRFSNFAHYRARWQILLQGKTPVTPSLPYAWYDTPNLHFLSIADFYGYCAARAIAVERAAFIGERRAIRISPNLFAMSGLFLLSEGSEMAGKVRGKTGEVN
jgi:methionine biosynthesis protein MetW